MCECVAISGLISSIASKTAGRDFLMANVASLVLGPIPRPGITVYLLLSCLALFS